jgi:succinate-semialdehyde dehydrogenase/glutarate-semialdehyde dehydrogenase
MYVSLALYIDGQFRTGEGRDAEPVIEPATGAVLAELPHATEADLDEAVAAAARAFPAWRATAPYDRSRVLRAAAALLRERVDLIARTMTREQGKVLVESRGEILHSADVFDWFAEEGRRAYGRVIPGRTPDVQQLVLVEPIGPCALLTPWNFPMLTPARKVAAALAAGCTIVTKAAEETPGTAVELFRALHDAGLPAGVANLVFGVPAKVSENLLRQPAIRKISFTGSTVVGKALLHQAADTVKRTTMELGGNAPVIVFEDADLDQAVTALASGRFRNAGQVCIAPSRFFVHESLFDLFVARFAERAQTLALGDGLQLDVTMGPLANRRRVDAMRDIVEDAKRQGGTILGGGIGEGGGSFFTPGIVTGIGDDALVMSAEIFGPITPIVPFADDDEVLARANRVEAGLAGYVFTQSIARSRRVMQELECGLVGINTLAVSSPETPFGGLKQSGYGQESGLEGLQAFQNIKYVAQA